MDRPGSRRLSASMTEESPRKVPRWLSCLVKGPLGCLSFLLGLAVVGALLLPFALGRLIDRKLPAWFERHHPGSLELGDVWVGSLLGPQHIDSVILRDPNGEEVLRGTLSAPSLVRMFGGSSHSGPIVLRLNSVRLVEYPDGSTNLGQALGEPESEGER